MKKVWEPNKASMRRATKGLWCIRRRSLDDSSDLSKDASWYLCIVVGLVVYLWCVWGVRVCGVGVCLYTNRCYSCIQMRGFKKKLTYSLRPMKSLIPRLKKKPHQWCNPKNWISTIYLIKLSDLICVLETNCMWPTNEGMRVFFTPPLIIWKN